MDCSMAIGKAKATGPVMVTGWQIVDPEARIAGANDYKTIVDAVRVFIYKHP